MYKQIYDTCLIPYSKLITTSYIIRVLYNILEMDAISYIIFHIV